MAKRNLLKSSVPPPPAKVEPKQVVSFTVHKIGTNQFAKYHCLGLVNRMYKLDFTSGKPRWVSWRIKRFKNHKAAVNGLQGKFLLSQANPKLEITEVVLAET